MVKYKDALSLVSLVRVIHARLQKKKTVNKHADVPRFLWKTLSFYKWAQFNHSCCPLNYLPSLFSCAYISFWASGVSRSHRHVCHTVQTCGSCASVLRAQNQPTNLCIYSLNTVILGLSWQGHLCLLEGSVHMIWSPWWKHPPLILSLGSHVV